MHSELGVTHEDLGMQYNTAQNKVAGDLSPPVRDQVDVVVSQGFTPLDVVLLKMAIMVTHASSSSHGNYLRELLLGLDNKALRIAADVSVGAILRGLYSLITLSNATEVNTHITLFSKNNNNSLTANETKELQNIQSKIASFGIKI